MQFFQKNSNGSLSLKYGKYLGIAMWISGRKYLKCGSAKITIDRFGRREYLAVRLLVAAQYPGLSRRCLIL